MRICESRCAGEYMEGFSSQTNQSLAPSNSSVQPHRTRREVVVFCTPPALAAQPLDLYYQCLRRRPATLKRPGRAILQARQSFAQIALKQLSDSPRADAYGFGDGLRSQAMLCRCAFKTFNSRSPRGMEGGENKRPPSPATAVQQRCRSLLGGGVSSDHTREI
ncbi:hypothetical protein MPLB_1460049 [Mesorhizobium sp. ORS 3324]|nr:hypothetical protein MPLB_1460049 [Mesorhizobium sp. ORS 3324]